MSKINTLSGDKLAGGNPKNGRVEYDFYATNPQALESLLQRETFDFSKFLEPCVGQGHLVNVIKPQIKNGTYLDIVNRGYSNTEVCDFLNWKTNQTFTSIITNPPYSLAKEFLEKSMEVLEESGRVAMFLKIQFLEGVKRIEMFKKYPPKYIYVFSKRMATWNNGKPLNEENKKWATTMCHAWFVWEKGNQDEPIVRWL